MNIITFVLRKYRQTIFERDGCGSGYEEDSCSVELYHAGEYIGRADVCEYWGQDPEVLLGEKKDDLRLAKDMARKIWMAYDLMVDDMSHVFNEETLALLKGNSAGDIRFFYIDNISIRERHIDKGYQESLLWFIDSYIIDSDRPILISANDYCFPSNNPEISPSEEYYDKLKQNYIEYFTKATFFHKREVFELEDNVLVVTEV